MSYAQSSATPRSFLHEIVSYGTAMLLVASAGLNLVQAKRLGVFDGLRPVLPSAGTSAPVMHVKSLDGEPVTLDFTGRPTILYYFSPQCGWCERNWPNIKALVAATEGRYRFVGLSTTADVADYLATRGLSFEVYSGVDAEAARVYYFRGTPHTVLVSGDGRVEHAWAGAYGPRQQTEMERAFGVVLPGVQIPPTARTDTAAHARVAPLR